MQNQFIVLLRGINVGGNNKIKMAELRNLLTAAGFQSVKTYIQSGNIVLNADETDENTISSTIKTLIAAHYGYQIEVLTISVSDYKTVMENNPFPDVPVESYKFLAVTLLSDVPVLDNLQAIEAKQQPSEQLKIVGKAFYMFCPNGYGKTKLDNKTIEKTLQVKATTRNWRSMLKILEMIG